MEPNIAARLSFLNGHWINNICIPASQTLLPCDVIVIRMPNVNNHLGSLKMILLRVLKVEARS